jgi:hypothetical protein
MYIKRPHDGSLYVTVGPKCLLDSWSIYFNIGRAQGRSFAHFFESMQCKQQSANNLPAERSKSNQPFFGQKNIVIVQNGIFWNKITNFGHD